MMTPTSQADVRICGARMHSLNGRLRTIVWVLALLVTSSFSHSQSQASGSSSDWKAIVQNRLPLYGHRNWIVVADSAFPVYAAPGIETIVVNDDLPSVLKYAATAISRHAMYELRSFWTKNFSSLMSATTRECRSCVNKSRRLFRRNRFPAFHTAKS